MYQLNQTKFLSKSELTQLRSTLNHYRDLEPRNVLLIELALYTGARASELLAITKADLNPDTHSVLIKGLKNSNDREIPLSTTLFKRITALPGDRPFNLTYSRLTQIWSAYKPSSKGFHALRHTAGLRLYAQHRDIKLVQFVLGHRSIVNTNIYCDYHFKTTELRRMLSRAF